MTDLPVIVTVAKANGVFSFSYSVSGINNSRVINVPKNTTANITLTLSPGTGSPTLSFATPALTWFDGTNQAVAIGRPIPFDVTESGGVVTIADNNSASVNQGTFCFLINVLADGMLLQSPDPTIINKDQ